MKDAPDVFAGGSQASNYIICQHGARAADRNFLDASAIVKGEQAVFFGSRQDLDSIASRSKNNLLGNSLTFDNFHSQPAFGADVDCIFVLAIERIGGNHYP